MANQYSYENYCSKDWYLEVKETGAYRDLNLEGWAHEIEWRLHFKDHIKNSTKGSTNALWGMFLDQLKLGTERTSLSIDIGSNPTKPVDFFEVENWFYSDTNILKGGLTNKVFINLSYDDKTLEDEFKKYLRSCRKKFTSFDKEFSCKRALTEDDAETWNKQKLLQYIDFKFCSDMTGCKFNENEMSLFFKLPESTFRQTTRKKAEDILNEFALGQIRASIALNKGILFK